MEYEFKVWDSDKSWDECPVGARVTLDNDEEATRFALILVEAFQTEVRFNRAGSTQGHYLGTSLKFARHNNAI